MKLGLRRTLMLAGGSLAIAGLMAAYSYTTASVANSATLSVVDTKKPTRDDHRKPRRAQRKLAPGYHTRRGPMPPMHWRAL